ncbi:aminotransferase class III-fold pyridoxal phosphate-dependent enzyme [Candidatus Acetothermia bacterium]|nr:aminotransferase class III-fold pyridoxal phosphate-dependent enzyme [Candidatus Acetothermia bacterium]
MARKLKLTKSDRLYKEACQLIPGGVLGIRRPYNFVPGEYPIFFESGKGGRVIDVDGNEYIDMLCAYGPIIIGHREEEIDEAVIEQIRNKGFCFSLTQRTQNALAKKMRELIPCAEQSLFVKTGSDAATAAIRIARAYTSRSKVARCGYHGWHDWCVEVKAGIPQKLYEDVYEFHYNDLTSLEAIMSQHGSETAAIIITPIGHPLSAKVEEPKDGFLEGVKEIAERYGAVLIFDEIRSGFRVSLGGAQELYNVIPDLSLFGKAMGNGYPISAVVGKAEIMDVARDKVFISSTFFPNSLGQIAALKTIEIMERDKILTKVREKGSKFCVAVEEIVSASGIPCEFSGAPLMPFITFIKDKEKHYKELRNQFYTELIRRGLFLQPYHHGYIAYRHTDEDLKQATAAIADALAAIKNESIKQANHNSSSYRS